MSKGTFSYSLVFLPKVNPSSFVLFVHNRAGSTKLRDYSTGVEKVVGQPSVADVFGSTVIDVTRFARAQHTVRDVAHWQAQILTCNSRHLAALGANSPAIVESSPKKADKPVRGAAPGRSTGSEIASSSDKTPLTAMLEHYRALERSSLTSRLEMAERMTGQELAKTFLESVPHFESYANVDQAFHESLTTFEPEQGQTVTYTVDLAKKLALEERVESERLVEVEGSQNLAFRYIDRELDCLRRTPGRLLEDGTPAKRAIVLDLLLENTDGTPILAEAKIRDDKDAFFALVQVLSAAAHLVTPAQRERLSKVYGLSFPIKDGPFVDLYIILFDHPDKGKRVEVLRESRRLAAELLDQTGVETFIRRITYLQSTEAHDGRLSFTLDNHLPRSVHRP